MIIIPAVDIKDGRCVRLLQGRMEDETVYGDSPRDMALRWQSEGAAILHIVDLNGAFEGRGVNDDAVRDIVEHVDMFTELGGGIRDMARIDALLGMGIGRVILGTVAVENPDLVSEAIDRYGPEKILVGIDAKNGIAATRGWADDGGIPAVELGREMKKRGVEQVVHTDITCDGMMCGPNIDETVNLAKETGLRITASGGISSLDDIKHLKEHENDGISSAITGKAIYENAFKLNDAIDYSSVTNEYLYYLIINWVNSNIELNNHLKNLYDIIQKELTKVIETNFHSLWTKYEWNSLLNYYLISIEESIDNKNNSYIYKNNISKLINLIKSDDYHNKQALEVLWEQYNNSITDKTKDFIITNWTFHDRKTNNPLPRR